MIWTWSKLSRLNFFLNIHDSNVYFYINLFQNMFQIIIKIFKIYIALVIWASVWFESSYFEEFDEKEMP